MAAIQHFRSAFNGFHRQDVVHYIEYLTNQHNSQIEQLNSQLQALRSQISDDTSLQAQLEAAQQKITQLEAALASQPEAKPACDFTQELEAYRRAERAERLAQERANQIYTQANAVLAEAAAKAEAAAANIGIIADQATAQLKQCQNSVNATKEAFQEAVATLYAIRPETESEGEL